MTQQQDQLPDDQIRLAYSAPGKALLAGGYLVLDQSYSAYVVALSARMHALIQGPSQSNTSRPSTGSTLGKTDQQEDPSATATITVKSPQFLNGIWSFKVSNLGLNAFQAEYCEGSQKNPFLKAAISVVMSYLKPSENNDLTITIYSDDAYHSQENPIKESLCNSKSGANQRFHSHSSPIQDVPKTGLGSSAALTTVVTAAIVGYYRSLNFAPCSTSSPADCNKTFDPASPQDLDIIHNLSQLAHCTAQGKIGSGFDVGSAVYGSIVYRRFPPTSLVPVIDIGASLDTSDNQVSSSAYCDAVKTIVDSPHADSIWSPLQHTPCSMPPGISILMGDVCGGSETPKLVSTVLQWRKNKPEEANKLWTELNAANMAFVETLNKLQSFSKAKPEEYAELLRKYASVSSEDKSNNNNSYISTPISCSDDLITCLKKNLYQIRVYLKQMTTLSQVPIEPDSQTVLIDRCVRELPGVIGGVVPGAGGFDAIALVVVSQSIAEIKSMTLKFAKNEGNSGDDDSVEKQKAAPSHLPITWLELGEQSTGLFEEKFDNPEYSLIN